MKEFVLIDDSGKEVDSVDPVLEFSEDNDFWFVDSVLNTYVFEKKDGYSYLIRDMVEEQG